MNKSTVYTIICAYGPHTWIFDIINITSVIKQMIYNKVRDICIFKLKIAQNIVEYCTVLNLLK